VIAAIFVGPGIVLDNWQAAHFSAPHHNGFIEQA
jgi:hypothetical protein